VIEKGAQAKIVHLALREHYSTKNNIANSPHSKSKLSVNNL